MRQLMMWVPRDRGEEVRSLAIEAGATHTLRLPSDSEDGPSDLVVAHMPNGRFDRVLDAVAPIEDLRMVFNRDSVVLLEPPAGDLPDQVTDVSSRGPLEILVEGLQSLGGWPSFLTYSAVAGAIVWVGLVTDTIFLLTAAMLIAPYAAPAMTTALATARGDRHLLARSVGRYLASVATTTAVAALLTVVAGVSEVTNLMVDVADVSAVSVLLPVAAGVAGAMSFGRPDRTGIVSGAGIGMLIALALAPQAGLMGIAMVLGEPRIVISSAFLATLQLLGINAAASLVFFFALDVRPRIPRARAGDRSVGYVSLGVTAVLTLALVVLQVEAHPELTRKTMMTRAEATVMAVLDEHPAVHPVEAAARFPLEEDVPLDLLVVEGRVVASGVVTDPDASALAELVRERLLDDLPGVDPQVGISVVGEG